MTDLLIYSSVWFILVINFLKTNSYIFVQYFFSAMKYGLLFWLLIFVYNDFIKNSENILMNSLCGMKNLINLNEQRKTEKEKNFYNYLKESELRKQEIWIKNGFIYINYEFQRTN